MKIAKNLDFLLPPRASNLYSCLLFGYLFPLLPLQTSYKQHPRSQISEACLAAQPQPLLILLLLSRRFRSHIRFCESAKFETPRLSSPRNYLQSRFARREGKHEAALWHYPSWFGPYSHIHSCKSKGSFWWAGPRHINTTGLPVHVWFTPPKGT